MSGGALFVGSLWFNRNYFKKYQDLFQSNIFNQVKPNSGSQKPIPTHFCFVMVGFRRVLQAILGPT